MVALCIQIELQFVRFFGWRDPRRAVITHQQHYFPSLCHGTQCLTIWDRYCESAINMKFHQFKYKQASVRFFYKQVIFFPF